MDELHDRFHRLDRIATPDLWNEAVGRAAALDGTARRGFSPMMALIAISGIFYPITTFPAWLQVIAQIFPIYWLGLGMRSALLPDELAAVEIGESWRHLETLGVLGAWAVAGLVVAPIVLRRMARRESGATVAERRQKAMQRVP